MSAVPFQKYPSTPHLKGSRLQEGDDAGEIVPFEAIKGRWIVVEEKADGAQAGFRASQDLGPQPQSRGDELRGGAKERQFSQYKEWLQAHWPAFLDRFEDRYLVYGEWMRVKHSMFYDALSHFWLQYDVVDLERTAERGAPVFLSTAAQQRLLKGLPIRRVPVLYEGPALSMSHLWSLVVTRAPGMPTDPNLRPDARKLGIKDEAVLAEIGPSSRLRTARWREAFAEAAKRAGNDPAYVLARSDASDWMEGLYIKIEEGEETVGRLKLVRPSFTQTIIEGGQHWSQHRFTYNTLDPKVDIFSPRLESAP